MSVLVTTSLGDLVIDLYINDCPIATKNFLKLCKIKYYNNVLFFNVQENFMIQTGDPTGTGKGGESIYGKLYGAQANMFEDEIQSHLTHNKKGLVGMANDGQPNTNRSQFYITTRAEDMTYLDGKHTIFGEVAEGFDILDRINTAFVDTEYRPYQDIRILHTYILDDPFPDPPMLEIPDGSPEGKIRPDEETVEIRLGVNEDINDTHGRTEEEIEESLQEKEAKSRAVVLEMLGDLPDADVKPPEEVLFVCQLNPVTESEDLDTAFCRFGPCKSSVIRDYKTGDSLCFGFVEFQEKRHCEEAYFKMNNVLLDDRRIKVDFSQSVSRLWNKVARKEKHTKGDDAYAMENGHSNKRTNSNRDKHRNRNNYTQSFTLKSKYRPATLDELDLVGEGTDSDERGRSSHRRHSSERRKPRSPNRNPRKRSRSRSDEHRHARHKSRGHSHSDNRVKSRVSEQLSSRRSEGMEKVKYRKDRKRNRSRSNSRDRYREKRSHHSHSRHSRSPDRRKH